MQVLEVRTYQAVSFQTKQETFFRARVGMEDLSMSLLDHGVLIKTKSDSAVVPFANIAYYKPVEVEAEPKKWTKK